MDSYEDRIRNFKINNADEAWEFAKFLVDFLDFDFYDSEIYKTKDFWGTRLKRIPLFKDTYRNNIIINLDLNKRLLSQQYKRANEICDYAQSSFAEMLCRLTDNKQNDSISYMSGDEEAEECNKQFYGMIDDFDALSNFDD